ncbi:MULTISPECIES: nucleoside-binding protein [Gammaproteobacteria]|uniref:nucleoside-binding protein n=1 Tax=Gammaproteobacteria TaxID=1236 RepID=UPI000DD08D63|nr:MULTISPECIES: nucleoside-binding protein [Gammaproteobacteria]RTE87673.1 nucleoside-binding protein [Aliidiomarina sp. B3213]TCZ92543.1 nucleoside-binding protein [Lysobacter sp. N42]
MKKIILSLTFSLLCFGQAHAETQWSSYSLTYLNGSDYEVGDPDREVLTFEYAAGTSWGSLFTFFDRLESSNGFTETYGEFSPRVRMMSFDEGGFLQAISASGTIEVGQGFTHYLYGIGSDWSVPGFSYFNVDLYRRNNDGGESNWQTTVVWGIPFAIGNSKWLYDGFMDWTSEVDDDNRAASMNLTSQLKWDIGHHFGMSTPLYVGVEYVYWTNKFGIDGVDERNANLLVKWHL